LQFDRRIFLGGLLAGAATGRAFAANGVAASNAPSFRGGGLTIDRRDATMLPVPSDYVPPTTLKAVADMYRRMTAPVRVNGRGPFPFVIDTGANQSVVSDSLAAQLGLKRGPLELLNSATGVQMAPTTLARLDLGDRAEEAVVLSILKETAIGGVGMLGVDRLDGLKLTLDFARQRLAIESSRRAWRDPDDIVMQANRRNGQLTLVSADLAGAPVTAFLDSGAQSTVGNLALKSLAVSQQPLALMLEVPILSVTGQSITAQMFDTPGLSIGGLRLPTWPVAFADLHTFELWDLIREPALMIGVDVLSRFGAVSLDFARDEVRFRDLAQIWSTQAA
jgi:hypothetical protein